jgi:Tfp pilus assembly protein PilO
MPLRVENAMNLRKMPIEKRKKLVLVLVATLLVVAGLYFLLIKHQNENLLRLANRKVEVQGHRRRVLETIRRTAEIEAELAQAQKALADAETDIASGDLYAWVIDTLRQFKAAYNVNIPQVSSLGPVTEVNLLPNFPYKQASLSLVGTAHFHDLGRFLADLENQFPHIRVVNLGLDLNPSAGPDDHETVSFKLDLITLVKTNPS